MVYCLHLSTSVLNRSHVIADTSSPLAREVFLPIRSTATRGGATPTARSAAPTGTSPADVYPAPRGRRQRVGLRSHTASRRRQIAVPHNAIARRADRRSIRARMAIGGLPVEQWRLLSHEAAGPSSV